MGKLLTYQQNRCAHGIRLSAHCPHCHEFYLQQQHEEWMAATIAEGEEMDRERMLEGVAWGIAFTFMLAVFLIGVAATW